MARSNSVDSVTLGDSTLRETLSLSREEFRKLSLTATGQPYDKLVVGAAAFRYADDNTGACKVPRILLLKRAAHEDYFPNLFELPGGKVDPEDSTIKHAIVREVLEETGLDVTKIVTELEPMTYTTEKTITDGGGRKTLLSLSTI